MEAVPPGVSSVPDPLDDLLHVLVRQAFGPQLRLLQPSLGRDAGDVPGVRGRVDDAEVGGADAEDQPGAGLQQSLQLPGAVGQALPEGLAPVIRRLVRFVHPSPPSVLSRNRISLPIEQAPLDLRRRIRPAEVEALQILSAIVPEPLRLGGGLDALDDELHVTCRK